MSPTAVIVEVIVLVTCISLSQTQPVPGDEGVEHGDIRAFFSLTTIDSQTDLVVLMDRSEGVNRKHFHQTEKNLIKTILKHHVDIRQNNVHVAIVTFAKDVTTVIDGITSSDVITKYDLFDAKNLWNKVKYDKNETVASGTYVDMAFDEAVRIFQTSNRPAVKNRVLLVATDGSFDDSRNPKTQKSKLTQDLSVAIFSVRTGDWSDKQFGNVQGLASNDEFYAQDDTWMKTADSMSPLAATILAPYEEIQDYNGKIVCTTGMTLQCDPMSGDCLCLCDNFIAGGRLASRTCQNPVNVACDQEPCHNQGVCHDGMERHVCVCAWGFSGYDCQINDNDCAYDVCDNNGTCSDKDNDFTCDCKKTAFCGGLCSDTCESGEDSEERSDSDEEDFPILYIIIAASAGGFLIVVLVFVCVCYMMCTRRKRKSRQSDGEHVMTSTTYEGEELGGFATTEQKTNTMATEISTQTYSDPVAMMHKTKPPKIAVSLASVLNGSPSGVIPKAPERRPDILRDVAGAAKQKSTALYQNVPEYKHMDKWCDYFTNLMVDENLKMCVMCLDATKWIATHKSALCSQKEFAKLNDALHDRQTGIELVLRRGTFVIQECDAFMLIARRKDKDRALTVGKSRQYFIVAEFPCKRTTAVHSTEGYSETSWIRQTIKNQGL